MTRDEELIAEFINRRGYLVVGCPAKLVPLPFHIAGAAGHFESDGSFGVQMHNVDSRSFYAFKETDAADMIAQNLLSVELAGVTSPEVLARARTAYGPFFYRLRAD